MIIKTQEGPYTSLETEIQNVKTPIKAPLFKTDTAGLHIKEFTANT